LSRHNPRQPKSTEEYIPNGTRNLTMEKKVHILPISFTQVAPIDYSDVPLLDRLSMVKIFRKVADQAKKGTLKGTLVHQALFPGK
jgi:hypothetical protein